MTKAIKLYILKYLRFIWSKNYTFVLNLKSVTVTLYIIILFLKLCWKTEFCELAHLTFYL